MIEDLRPVPRQPQRTRERVDLPKGLSIEQGVNEMRVIRRWYSPAYFFLAFFCLLWDGVLLSWYASWILNAGSDHDWLEGLFPMLHVAAGFFLTYVTAAGFINRTTISLAGSRLAVRHHPLPWPGAKTIDVHAVDQLHCEKRIRKTKNGTSTSYDVLITSQSVEVPLVKGLDDGKQALFIEQTIEDYLGITDRRVAGEVGRNAV